MADEITINSNGVSYKALVTTSPAAAGAGATQVVGNVASGTADSGNPVKAGARIATSKSAAANGLRTDLVSDPFSNLYVRSTGMNFTSMSAVAAGWVGVNAANNPAFDAPLGTTNFVYNGTNMDVARGDTNGVYAVAKGSGGIATSQVSVGTAATQIVAARAGRGAVTITNVTGAQQIFIGTAGVTAATGTLLPAAVGASLTIPTNAAIFGIALTAAQTVSVLEVF